MQQVISLYQEEKNDLINLRRILHNTILMLVVRDLALELFKVPPGMDKWSFCLQAAKGGFGEVMSGLYLQQFPPSQLDNYRKKVIYTILYFQKNAF